MQGEGKQRNSNHYVYLKEETVDGKAGSLNFIITRFFKFIFSRINQN